jgi:hypothetical protein
MDVVGMRERRWTAERTHSSFPISRRRLLKVARLGEHHIVLSFTAAAPELTNEDLLSYENSPKALRDNLPELRKRLLRMRHRTSRSL